MPSARSLLTRAFSIDVWNVGILDRPIHTLLTSPDISDAVWLPESPDATYTADPFGCCLPGEDMVCAEYFSYRTGKGHIVRLDLEAGSPPTDCLTRPEHLSYPFLLVHDNRLLCIPECAEAHGIFVYEWDGCVWRFLTPMLEGVQAIDPTLYFFNGYWWLWYTKRDMGANNYLCLSYSEKLSESWSSHPKNPIANSPTGSRPAGTPFCHEGVLYRPAQDSSTEYGGGVVIQRISELSPTSYSETPAENVLPSKRSPYPHGVHTLSAWGNRTLIDGKRRRRHVFASLFKLGIRLRTNRMSSNAS